MRQYPDAFAGHDVEDAIQNDMMLFYFPMALADLRMMASFPGKGAEQGDPGVLRGARLGVSAGKLPGRSPYGHSGAVGLCQVGPFDPAMQEGDFRVVSVDASTKDQVVIDKLALDIAQRCRGVLGFNKRASVLGRARPASTRTA
ncbi:MAG: hypothetical protein ACLS3M_00605 [Collinsella sp.]